MTGSRRVQSGGGAARDTERGRYKERVCVKVGEGPNELPGLGAMELGDGGLMKARWGDVTLRVGPAGCCRKGPSRVRKASDGRRQDAGERELAGVGLGWIGLGMGVQRLGWLQEQVNVFS